MERFEFENLKDGAKRLGTDIENLKDLQNDFKNVTSQIGESGSDLGGELGEFSRDLLEREINAKLNRLTEYTEQLKAAIEVVVATNQEVMNASAHKMENEIV